MTNHVRSPWPLIFLLCYSLLLKYQFPLSRTFSLSLSRCCFGSAALNALSSTSFLRLDPFVFLSPTCRDKYKHFLLLLLSYQRFRRPQVTRFPERSWDAKSLEPSGHGCNVRVWERPPFLVARRDRCCCSCFDVVFAK